MQKRQLSLHPAPIMAINKLLTPRQRMDLLEFLVQHQPSSNDHLRSSRLAYHRHMQKRSNSLSDENFSTDENDYIDENQRFINPDILSLKLRKKASFAKSEPVSFVKLVNSNRPPVRNKYEFDLQNIGSFSEENISLDDDSSSSGYSKTSTKSSASGSNYDLEAYETYVTVPPVSHINDSPEFPSDVEDPHEALSLTPDDARSSISTATSEEKDLATSQDNQMVAEILGHLLAERESQTSPYESRSQSLKKTVSLGDLNKLTKIEAFKPTFYLDEPAEISVTVPALFAEFKAPFERGQVEDGKLVNLLKTDNGLLEFIPSEFDKSEERVPEKKTIEDQELEHLDEPKSEFNFTEDDLREIDEQLELKKSNEKSEEETEMQFNWRKYLEKKSCEKRFRDELNNEDFIDAFAYLNEIEMNLDYFQSELTELYEHHGSSSYWHSDPMSIDTLLTYKSNRDAFNLRKYHEEIELQRQFQIAYENGEFADYDYEFEYDCEYDCNYDYTYEHDENEEPEYQFEMEQESDSSVNSAGGGQANKKALQLSISVKPCVFKLNEGQCLKPDCRFAHDFENITCKYWLEGACFKGDTCEFYHGIVEQDASLLSGVNRIKHNSRNRSSASFSSSVKSSAKRKNKSKRGDSVENAKMGKALEPEFKLEMEEFPPLGS